MDALHPEVTGVIIVTTDIAAARAPGLLLFGASPGESMATETAATFSYSGSLIRSGKACISGMRPPHGGISEKGAGSRVGAAIASILEPLVRCGCTGAADMPAWRD